MASASSKTLALLPATVITTAVTGATGSVFGLPAGAKYMMVEANFVYGSGGTTAKFWIQTRVAGGTWVDVANAAFTTSTAVRFSNNSIHAAAASSTASDAALADNTLKDGLLGDEVRVKYTTTGTYAGNTTITITAAIKFDDPT